MSEPLEGRDLLRRKGLRAEEVMTYIKIGRLRIVGTRYDPYRKLKEKAVHRAMLRDAMTIAH